MSDHAMSVERMVEGGSKRGYHYTRDGHGIIEAVCKMFEGGTFMLGEGDALIPVQEAYLAYRKARSQS